MEHIIVWGPRLASCLLLLIGIIGFFKPKALAEPTGIQMTNGTAMSEVRAAFGGIMLGLGSAALALDDPTVYACIGAGFLGVLLARFYSMLVDDVPAKTSISAVVIDSIIAFPLLIGFISAN